MGGCLSDTPEMKEMMSLHELEQLPTVIQNAMVTWNFNAANTILFLSTDSTYAEKYIKAKLGSVYTVVTSDAFHRGHTTGSPDGVTIQRVLIDLFLLSDSDAILFCRGSGFGSIATSMGRARKFIEYRVTHRLIPNYKVLVGSYSNCSKVYSIFYLSRNYLTLSWKPI